MQAQTDTKANFQPVKEAHQSSEDTIPKSAAAPSKQSLEPITLPGRPSAKRQSLEPVTVKGKKSAEQRDIGGGDSRLVDFLLDEGFEDITVLDISGMALKNAAALQSGAMMSRILRRSFPKGL